MILLKLKFLNKKKFKWNFIYRGDNIIESQSTILLNRKKGIFLKKIFEAIVQQIDWSASRKSFTTSS